jgi:hypothetical protein
MSNTNSVNNPPHYQGCSPIGSYLLLNHFGVTDEELNRSCIDFLESHPQYCGFHLGNAIKYLWRCGNKGDAIEDLQKAHWYLWRWRCRCHPIFLSVDTPDSRKKLTASVDKLIKAIEEELPPMTVIAALLATPIALSLLPHLLPGAKGDQSETAKMQRALFEAAMRSAIKTKD